MTINYIKGDLFSTPDRFIVHGCNSQGVMGSGVAKLIREKYPKAYDDYRKKSKSGRFAVSSDFKVMQEDEMLSKDNILQTVYSIQKGSWPVVVKDDFETIRARARV